MKLNNVNHCRLMPFNTAALDYYLCTQVVGEFHIPFPIRRIYYLYDIPSGESRGGHAHKTLSQIVVAVSGSFDVVLSDGNHQQRFTLSKSNRGLLVVPGIWREIQNFSSGSVCLVLASESYSEEDYIRDFVEFEKYKKSTGNGR